MNGTLFQLNWTHPVSQVPLNLLQDRHGFKYGWHGSVPYYHHHHHHHHHALSVIQKYTVNAVYPILHNAQRQVKHWNKAKHWSLMPTPCEGEKYFSEISLHPVNTIKRWYKWCHLKVMYQRTNDVTYSDVNSGSSTQFTTEIACDSRELLTSQYVVTAAAHKTSVQMLGLFRLIIKYTHKSSWSNRSCLPVWDEGTRVSGGTVTWRSSSTLS